MPCTPSAVCSQLQGRESELLLCPCIPVTSLDACCALALSPCLAGSVMPSVLAATPQLPPPSHPLSCTSGEHPGLAGRFQCSKPCCSPPLCQQILANPARCIWSLGTVLPVCPHFSIPSANLGPLSKAAAWLPSCISIWLLSMGIWTLTTALIPCLSFNKRPASPLTPRLEAVGPRALHASSRGNLVSHPSCQPCSSGTHMFENRSSSSSPIHCFSPSFALLNIDFLLHY